MRCLLTEDNYSHHPRHRLRDWLNISYHPHVLRPGLRGTGYHFHWPPACRTIPSGNPVSRRCFRSDIHAVDRHWALHGWLSTKYASGVLSPMSQADNLLLTGTGRIFWAFSRDGALPFSST